MKLALMDLVRVKVRGRYGPEFGTARTVRKLKNEASVRLHDVTHGVRVLVGYAFVDGNKYRVVVPQRFGWSVGVASRVIDDPR